MQPTILPHNFFATKEKNNAKLYLEATATAAVLISTAVCWNRKQCAAAKHQRFALVAADFLFTLIFLFLPRIAVFH